MNSVLVVGDNGQDGKIIVSRLREKKLVIGVGRSTVINYKTDNVAYYSSQKQLYQCLSGYKFEKMYFLASLNEPAQQTKGDSKYPNPVLGELPLLECILNIFSKQVHDLEPWAFFASSALIFGDPIVAPQDEKTALNPKEKYALNKIEGMNLFKNTLDQHGIANCIGILYPHESEFRKLNFLFPKLINAAKKRESVHIYDSSFRREWNDACEFVECFQELSNRKYSGLICIGSGKSYSIDEVGEYIFCEMGLNWHEMKRDNLEPIKVRSANLVCNNALLKRTTDTTPSGDYKKLVKRVLMNGLKNVS